MAERKPLIAGNWKLNNNHLEAIALVQKLAFALKDPDFDAAEIAVLPPFTNLRSVQTLVEGDKLRIGYGAQDVSAHENGAFTGEVSGPMLAKLGCTYALAGHSERREYHQEDDSAVNAKVKAAFAADLTPILCLGEGLDVRKAGNQVSHTLGQLEGALKDVTAEQAGRLVVAYEPVWAIGTGEVATPEDAQEVCSALRGRLSELYSDEVAGAVRIIYGGSVKSDNIADIVGQEDVDGALVGGASLKPEEFTKLARLGRE
ncbi:triose-phosphate isomerase [Streptomonospora salina]|uniref:Triosephosphate isomerase n=1 Tax=Streptomonospora salina TaxID=104205 RepID=A0A841EGZ5_9ACTN|nr:triose-phosphate isomerase [Streptomonospora salina]MBB6000639.1 triosephosphate isomerase [Streptomonospora salina]